MANLKLIIAATFFFPFAASAEEFSTKWPEFKKEVQAIERRESSEGLSYVISGSLLLLGGLVGQNAAVDRGEKGVYILFQGIGVMSIGHGFSLRNVGSDLRVLGDALSQSRSLSVEERSDFLTNYHKIRTRQDRHLRKIRMLSHLQIAGLGIYNSTLQTNKDLQNALMLVGVANGLAALTITFEL